MPCALPLPTAPSKCLTSATDKDFCISMYNSFLKSRRLNRMSMKTEYDLSFRLQNVVYNMHCVRYCLTLLRGCQINIKCITTIVLKCQKEISNDVSKHCPLIWCRLYIKYCHWLNCWGLRARSWTKSGSTLISFMKVSMSMHISAYQSLRARRELSALLSAVSNQMIWAFCCSHLAMADQNFSCSILTSILFILILTIA